eukprot:scaffold2923_cov121-Cylindrotheca_fusiformis.AAC.6
MQNRKVQKLSPEQKQRGSMQTYGTTNNGVEEGIAKKRCLAPAHARGVVDVLYDIEAAAKRAIKDGDKFAKLAAGFFQNMLETFHRAVALFAMARCTRKRKYRSQADKLASRIAGWVRSGNPNIRHYQASMKAEQAALSKKYDLAEENYKNVIVLAAKTGHMHHAALINERYAEFLGEESSDEEESKHRFGEAIRFYEEWEAFGKVEMLKNQLHWFLSRFYRLIILSLTLHHASLRFLREIARRVCDMGSQNNRTLGLIIYLGIHTT